MATSHVMLTIFPLKKYLRTDAHFECDTFLSAPFAVQPDSEEHFKIDDQLLAAKLGGLAIPHLRCI